jgi:glc operon protein GlcG
MVDNEGSLVYLEHTDETQLGSIQVTEGKAHTALFFKRPTKPLEGAVGSGRNNLITLPNAALVHGGIPLMADGKIIGAIGVSGGMSSQDGVVAKARADAFTKMMGHWRQVRTCDWP